VRGGLFPYEREEALGGVRTFLFLEGRGGPAVGIRGRQEEERLLNDNIFAKLFLSSLRTIQASFSTDHRDALKWKRGETKRHEGLWGEENSTTSWRRAFRKPGVRVEKQREVRILASRGGISGSGVVLRHL